MRPLPSLVTISVDPVSATTKLAPDTPMSADRKCGRSFSRASRHSAGMSVSRGALCFSANRSETSSRVLCTTGATMCDGGSFASCRMYSPRSVSTTSSPAASSASLSPHSSVTIDFDLMTLRTPCCAAISRTMRFTSSWVSAQCTTVPRAVALRSKVSSQTSRFSSARSRIAAAASRMSGKLSSSAMRSARPLTKLPCNFFRAVCSLTSASFAPARALKCMEVTCMAASISPCAALLRLAHILQQCRA